MKKFVLRVKLIMLICIFMTSCTKSNLKLKEGETVKKEKTIKKEMNIRGIPVVKTKIEVDENNFITSEKLFSETVINVKENTNKNYVYGDNHAGYSESYPFSYNKGELYNISGNVVIKDFATAVDDILNNRTEKETFTNIYLYGSETIFKNNAKEVFMLQNKKQVITIGAETLNESIISLIPLFTNSKDKIKIENRENIIIIEDEGKQNYYPKFMAITSNKDFSFENLSDNVNNKFTDVLDLKENIFKCIIKPTQKTKDFYINISFSNNKEEAVNIAKEFAEKDAVAEHKKFIFDFIKKSFIWTNDKEFNRALAWSKLSSYSLFVDEYGPGIWAGLPWFRDNWGRDTFISLPGTLLVNGLIKDSKELITNFSKYQNIGDIILEVEYTDKESKDKAVQFIRENFNFNISNKKGKIVNPLLLRDIKNLSQTESKIEEMNKINGIKAKYTIEYGKNYGRIPNRISNPEDIIYNTTDGTPWMIREIYEYLMYSGDVDYAKEIYPVIKLAVEQAIKNYMDENGFLTHAAADTWMDAKFDENPWSPRGNRANDIQALWYTALKISSNIAKMNGDSEKNEYWNRIAQRLKDNFLDKFWDKEKGIMADRITEDDKKDFRIRPNQLMTMTIPLTAEFITEEIGAKIVKKTVNELTYPYGIASLSEDDIYFHPYHISSTKYEKDAAYHNGTIWGWNAGFGITSILKYGYSDFAYSLTENLCNQINNMGCLGSMSENIETFPDKEGNINLSGTYSQAWSVAEFNRNSFQDYLGFKPDLINEVIDLYPAVPQKWNEFYSEVSFGKDSKLKVEYLNNNFKKYSITVKNIDKNIKLKFGVFIDFNLYGIETVLENEKTIEIIISDNEKIFKLNGETVEAKLIRKSYENIIGKLEFRNPNIGTKYNSLEKEGYLRDEISSNRYFLP